MGEGGTAAMRVWRERGVVVLEMSSSGSFVERAFGLLSWDFVGEIMVAWKYGNATLLTTRIELAADCRTV
jgi:hypothetical protein